MSYFKSAFSGIAAVLLLTAFPAMADYKFRIPANGLRQPEPGVAAAQAPSQAPSQLASCTWEGATLEHNATLPAYSGSVATTGECATKAVTQSCNDGVLAFPTATSTCVVADPYHSSVALLIHFDSGFTPTIGSSPTVVNAVIDTTVSRFGGFGLL